MTDFIIVLLIIIFIIIVLIFYWWYSCVCRKENPKVVSNYHDALEILASKDYSRSRPNWWMINTFSIVNPFTIDSDTLLESFKQQVKEKLIIYKNADQYEKLVHVIRQRIDSQLQRRLPAKPTIILSKFIEQVTLDAFLSGILNIETTSEVVEELPDLIIHLWKHRDDKYAQHRLKQLISNNQDLFSKSEFWQQLQQVLSNHCHIISKFATNGFEEKITNPLNIIVPGWETMWRVTFYTLLELLHYPELKDELILQLKKEPQFYHNCKLLQYILKEVLRLYPPTKNIYRTHKITGESVQISIQNIHRNEDIWGPDACKFRPDRFSNQLTEEQRRSYLPFSNSCPARHSFAYLFASTLVAEILHRCPDLSIANTASTFLENDLLDLSRDSYRDLSVIA